MATPKRLAWDACTWIAAITLEKCPLSDGLIEDRGAMCLPILQKAQAGTLEIATSGLALAEVCRSAGVRTDDKDVLADFFRREFILVVPVDRHVGTLARELIMDGHSGLKPGDATYVAAAIVASADELQTFDDRLLKLDGRVPRLDGGMLRICKPALPPLPVRPPTPAPLLDKLDRDA